MQSFQLKILGLLIMDLRIMLVILTALGIIVGSMLLGKQWMKKSFQLRQTTQVAESGEKFQLTTDLSQQKLQDVDAKETQLTTDLPQQKLQDVDAKKTSQGALDPTKTPSWYLEQAMKLHKEAQGQLSKVIIFQGQCRILIEDLGMATKSSRKSLHRSLSSEHKRECLGTLKLIYQLAKEVGSFISECCNEETFMQAALTWAIVPKRVFSWRRQLQVCTELLCNSNKMATTWLNIAENSRGSLGELECFVTEETTSDEDLMGLLGLILDQGEKSKLNVSIPMNVEFVDILLKHWTCRAMSNVGSSQSSPFGHIDARVQLLKVDSKTVLRKMCICRRIYGKVFEGEWLGAIKVAIKDDNGPLYIFRPTSEGIASWLSHPNIVLFLGSMDNDRSNMPRETKTRSTIMELMDGDLRTLMVQIMQEGGNREGPFSIWEACNIMLQVAEGVLYMHQNKIAHRDLKSSKILFKMFQDNTLEYICAKVCGFGVAKWHERSITISSQTFVGTRSWMAPEMLISRDAILPTTQDTRMDPFKLDVYSFGITCFEILTGDKPFSNQHPHEVKVKVLKGDRPTLPQTIPQSLRNLIKLCWDPEPKVRPSFADICKELRYIRCSLLLEPRDYTPLLLPVLEPLHFPPQVLKFKGEYSSLKVVRKLASGGDSDMVTLYLSTWLQPENKVAQKRFMGSHNKCFKNEVSIMAELEHPNVVRLLCYASDKRSCSIVMELMDGDLYDLMDGKRLRGEVSPLGPFSLAIAMQVMLQIAQGMEYVHEKYVVHRDLKSCNILIKKASKGRKLEVKVADFGVSKKLKSGDTLLGKVESGAGTMRWMAPEVTSVPSSEASSKYDPFKSDVFSYGMLCYEILVGRVPFYKVEDLDTVRKKVLDGERPTLPEQMRSNLKDLIEKCWVEEPSERPTFTDIVGELMKVRV